MALQTEVWKDKTHAKLDDKEIRKKIIDGKLKRAECDNEEVFEFIQSLKRSNSNEAKAFKPMEKDEWSRIVKKASKRSASSFFLRRIESFQS